MADKKIIDFDPEMAASKSKEDRDRLFAEQEEFIRDFKFDKKTAGVFDDMVDRSVPFYGEIQRMISELAGDFAVPGTRLFDLGCATGNSLLAVDRTVDENVSLVGIDNSPEMLAKAESKFTQAGMKHTYQLVESDLENYRDFDNASVALMVLTLQFIRPLQRQRIITDVYNGLNPDGALILVEKLSFGSTLLNRLFIKYYYELKRRNGYSETEIAQKREALENVLIPYRYEENAEMLKEVGFRYVDQFFRWYNFCGIVAVK
ncbi:MAG: carboxy-S-adenosyl-L-methionine synthase CmoA [Rhodospirillales bacterium]